MRVIVVTDSHLAPAAVAFNTNWRAVREFIATSDADLTIHLGDVTVDGFDDPTQFRHAQAISAGWPTPMRYLPGNHDIGDNPPAPGVAAEAPLRTARLDDFRAAFGPDYWTLDGKDGGQVRSLFCVGFCFGGAVAYLQAATGLGYAGVIGFYGWPLGLKRWPDRPKPIDAVSRYKAPVLSIFGGADEGIPEADRNAFAEACKKAGVKHEEHVYPGAPHSFFDRKFDEFKEVSADAWARVQGFVKANTK